MEIRVGDKFIEYDTGNVYECTGVSTHKYYLTFKYRKPTYFYWIQVMNPMTSEEVTKLVKGKKWIPDTPAGRILYAAKKR